MKGNWGRDGTPVWEDPRRLAMFVKSFEEMKAKGITSMRINKHLKRGQKG